MIIISHTYMATSFQQHNVAANKYQVLYLCAFKDFDPPNVAMHP